MKKEVNLYYSKCEDLPLYNFIKISILRDFSYLWHNRLVTDESIDLEAVYEEISQEYQSLSGDTSQNQVLSIMKDITIDRNTVTIVQIVVDNLNNRYSSDLCQALKDMGFNYPLTPETLYDDLQEIVFECKRMVIDIQDMEKDLSEMTAEDDSEPFTEKSFYSVIARMSKHFGFKIDTKQTTTFEFIVYIDQYNKS